MRYLNPKADLTFKKVFGENPDLIISFLNALLPLDDSEQIEHVEYLNPELVPQNPLSKDSIVDVRCYDVRGRQFIVEMQMMWTSAYKQRVLFNASKAYVTQLERGEEYDLLQPVYSLSLVNDTFCDSPEYYHDYRIVEVANTKEVIEGLRFIFVELPKFTPHSYAEKRMQVLWLRYLTEIDEKTREVSPDLMGNPEIGKAVAKIEESAFTKAQLLGYDKFWDIVSTRKTWLRAVQKAKLEAQEKALAEGRREGRREGLAKGKKQGLVEGKKQGLAEGKEQGLAEGRNQALTDTARRMKEKGMSVQIIADVTGLLPDDVASL